MQRTYSNHRAPQTSSQTAGLAKQMRERFGNKPLASWDADSIISFGDQLGRYLKDKRVSTNQVRRFIDELQRVKNMQEPDLERVKFMKVKLVYAVGRAEREAQEGLKEFEQCVSYCLENLKTVDDMHQLIRFIETVIAYHRYYGGN
jgi:CRISPR-associated protein Csm2